MILCYRAFDGVIGEVVNTADCGSVMRGFDPHIAPQKENRRTICVT